MTYSVGKQAHNVFFLSSSHLCPAPFVFVFGRSFSLSSISLGSGFSVLSEIEHQLGLRSSGRTSLQPPGKGKKEEGRKAASEAIHIVHYSIQYYDSLSHSLSCETRSLLLWERIENNIRCPNVQHSVLLQLYFTLSTIICTLLHLDTCGPRERQSHVVKSCIVISVRI